nr:hypothetical protein [Knoellia locipacati]
MTGPLDDDELGPVDVGLEPAGHLERRAGVELAPHEQRRHVDLGEQVAEVGRGHDPKLQRQRVWAHVCRDLLQERHDLRRRLTAEEPGQRRVEVLGRRLE